MYCPKSNIFSKTHFCEFSYNLKKLNDNTTAISE